MLLRPGFFKLVKGMERGMVGELTRWHHVHGFMGAPPWYAPAEVVKIIKSITAGDISAVSLREKEPCREEFWGDR
jgi:hypothetical protein